MIRLPNTLGAWQSDSFASTLKRELGELPPGVLPLHEGTSQGGLVEEASVDFTLAWYVDRGARIHARVGAFFQEIVGGCSCGEDPMLVPAHCELDVSIDKDSGEARVTLAPE